MPEHLRALIVILLLSSVVFAFAKLPATDIDRNSDFRRRRNVWFVITAAAFLAHNFWIFVLVAGAVLFLAKAKEPNPVNLFLFMLFAMTANGVDIPAFGLVNYLFELSYQRLLVLVVLLPAYLSLRRDKGKLPFGRSLPDKILAMHLMLVVALYLRETTITDTLRQAFYQFIDVFLPYYVISRSLKKIHDFREAILYFIIAIMILAVIGVFETARHWQLYSQLEEVLDIGGRFNTYGARAGILRARASLSAIPLGYTIAVGIALYMYFQHLVQSKFVRRMGLLLLIAGLVSTVSRGPWVGAVFLYLVFVATGPNATKHLSKFLVGGLAALVLASFLPVGEKIINMLPFVGETGQKNISYRQQLFTKSLVVISRNPWLGSVDYLETAEMEEMRQGQGIIDIVNAYLRVTLESGYLGLALYAGFFLSIGWGVFRSYRKVRDKRSEEVLLGRALLAAMAGIMLIIFTAGKGSVIPVVYWSVSGLCAAYIAMMHRSREQIKENNEKIA